MRPAFPDSQHVVLIDKKDSILGVEEKERAHQKPFKLHRAISVFIFDPLYKKMLITRRSRFKKTWPLFWSNAVCSHPFFGESYYNAAKRRVKEELGIKKIKLEKATTLIYKASYNNLWGEYEYDVVFFGTYPLDGKIVPNREEVESYKWIDISLLFLEIKKRKNLFTPWFRIILKKLLKEKKIKF